MDPKEFGRFVAAERRAAGLTQGALAARVGVTDKAVSKWERGVCLPDVARFRDIADALGVTEYEVFRAARLPAGDGATPDGGPVSDAHSPAESAAVPLMPPRAVGRLLLGCLGVSAVCFLVDLSEMVTHIIGLSRFLQPPLCLLLGIRAARRDTAAGQRTDIRSVEHCTLFVGLMWLGTLFLLDNPYLLWDDVPRLFGMGEFCGFPPDRWTPATVWELFVRLSILDFPAVYGAAACLTAYPIARRFFMRWDARRQVNTTATAAAGQESGSSPKTT